jgi:hypothetical protein
MQTNPDQLVNIPAIMTIGLKKSISPEQLMAGIQLVAAENGPGSVSMTSETRDGVDLIAIRPTTPTDGGPQEFLAALSPNGQTIMVSMNAASLASASQRLAAGKMAAPSEAMRGALQALKKSPFRMAFIFPAFLKDQMSANLAADPMMGTLAGMQAISVDANADTALQVNLRLDMGSPDAASNAMCTIQGMMAMMPMMLGSMPPQVAATAQKIKVANDGNYVHIQARVDEKDLEGLGQPVDGM